MQRPIAPHEPISIAILHGARSITKPCPEHNRGVVCAIFKTPTRDEPARGIDSYLYRGGINLPRFAIAPPRPRVF